MIILSLHNFTTKSDREFRRRSFLLKYLLFIYPVGILGIFYYFIIKSLFPNYAERFCRNFPKWISKLILRINSVIVQIEGDENLQWGDGGCVFICNHESILDSYVCLSYLAKHFKLFQSNTDLIHRLNMRITLKFLRIFNVTFLHDRNDNRRTLLEFQNASSYVQSGGNLLLFPEGKTSPDGIVHDFTVSSFRIPITNKVPIVPVIIRGSRVYLEDYEYAKCLLPVRLKILPPLSIDSMNKREQLQISKMFCDLIRDHYSQMADHEKEG